MKLTKELKAEILDVYEAFWGSLLHADIQLYAAVLDADYRLVGTTEKEIFFNKKEAVHFLKSTADQMAGSLERRKSKYKIELIDGFVLITEQFDAYVLIENDWTFYGQTRVSTWMSKKAQGWKIIQQHFSFPDAKTEEGQTIGLEKISKENLELREAIKRRTIELESKNQELEIESALERVRTVAMAMQHRDDMLDMCQVIAKELENLAVTNIRNIQTAIINTEKETYLNYEYFRLQKKKVITAVEYKKHKDILAFVKRMLKDPEGFFTTQFQGASLKQWIQYQVKTGQFVDPVTKKAASLHYYFYSIGPGALGISTYAPLTKEAIALFKRFRNVFQLAYRRFMDIEKAMEQAKEAQIEASLEKVRAQALGMRKPEDLPDVCEVLFKELQTLGFSELRNAMVNIHNDEKRTFVNYDYSDEIGKTFTPLFYDIHPVIKRQISQIRKADDAFSETVFKGKDLESWKAFRKSRGEKEDKRIKNSTALYYYFYSLGTGSIGVSAFHAIGEEKLELLKRFRNVFAFAYRRYMDVAQAEAQAREAQIELALERVRARTMAMQHSEELLDTVAVMFEQFKALGEEPERMAIEIVNEKEHVFEIWATQHGGAHLNALAKISLDEPHVMQKMYKAWKSKTRSITIDLQGDELKEYFNYLKKAGLPVQRKIFGKRRLQNVATFSKGILTIITPEPRPQETIQLLERFASVFDGTYTRFLDLQKAEAQTREAQIETSLERIRAASLAMRDSAALGGIIYKLYGELTKLDAQLDRCFIMIVNPENKGITWWMAGQEGLLAENGFFVQMNQHASHLWYLDCWKKRRKKWQYLLAGKEKRDWDRFGFSKTELARLPEFIKKFMAGVNKINLTGSSDQFGSLVTGSFEPLPDEQQEIINRFTIAFNQAYIRFLDLQKAEAQAREAQIEAALERVRSRSMAMHTSQELNEVALELRKQMGLIGQKDLEVCAIHLYDKDDSFKSWSAMKAPGSESEIIQTQARFPNKGIKIVDELMKHYSKGSRDYVLVNEGDKMVEWFKVIKAHAPALHASIMRSVGKMPVKKLKANWSVADFSGGALVMVTYGEPDVLSRNLLRRSANVFEQAYTRFLDLKKAEAQAREAEIELALERVRARTMAMQHSSELSETSALLFQQIKTLGVPPWSCGFNIWEQGDTVFTSYMGSPDGTILDGFKIPLTEEASFIHFQESRDRGDKLFIDVLEGETLEEHYRYFFTLPGIKEAFEKKEQDGEQRPTFQINHLANFAHGNLMFITYKPCPEAHDIFIRFANVFDQTYTRFLDLQKAEAQTREAKIEMALERVRSRSLAMHSSGELGEVVTVVLNNLTELGYIIDQGAAAHLAIFSEGTKDFVQWSADPALAHSVRTFIPYTDLPILTEFWDARQKGHDFFANVYSFDEKNTWFNYAFEHSDLKHIPGELKKLLLESETYAHSIAIEKNSAIIINSITGNQLSENQIDILRRFSKVFEQAYVRFLDLQKAEAQAREAQIEASLERVRARTMAMHNSNDVSSAIATLFTELERLGIENRRCGIAIIDTNKTMEVWSVTNVDEGKTVQAAGTFDMNAHKLWLQFYDSWQKKSGLFHYYLAGKEKKDYIRILNKTQNYLSQPVLEMPDMHFQTYHFKEGAIWTFSMQPHAEEQQQLMNRFTSVFSQTFRRYQDLQKAEAQTREAQIELGLERVRARAMAMQKSDELKELIGTVYAELTKLDIALVRCLIWVMDSETLSSRLWMANSEAPSQPASFYIPYHENPPYLAFVNAWKEKNPKWQYDLKGQIKKEWDQYVFQHTEMKYLPEPVRRGMQASERVLLAGSFHSFGCLQTAGTEQLNDEHFEILNRFAKVFDLTYTRFNDLKKAEAQAKEAQIELGLERVRARAMAMQHSNELSDLVDTVFKELTKLDFAINMCIINIIDESTLSNMVWGANPDTGKPPESYYMKFEDYPFHHAMMKGYQERASKFIYVIEGEEKKIYDEYLFTETEFSKMPLEAQAASKALKKYVASFTFSNFGGLQTVASEDMSDEKLDILERFGKVFDLTYTRFNDLQKAEAQAKEAQIEAALERVRSRSMAMHTSDELKEVIKIVYQQLTHVKINLDHAGFVIDYTPGGDWHFWIADEQDIPAEISHPYFESVWATQFNEAKAKGTDFFATQLNFEEKNSFYKELLSYVPGLPQASKDFYLNCPGLAASTVLLANVALYIENFSGTSYTEEENTTLMRFGKVFQQSYTRFLDLQKAEAQAREAQIEASLERVRSRSMAMHKSDELLEAGEILFLELQKLGIESLTAGYVLMDKEEKNGLNYTPHPGTKKIMPVPVIIPHNETSHMQQVVENWRQGNPFFIIEMNEEETIQHQTFIAKRSTNFPLTAEELIAISPPGLFLHNFYFKEGYILIVGGTKLSEEQTDIMLRFAKVFQQTYTRFLDLQKAEAQAREAKIEAALEKARSRSMGMQSSDELPEVANVLFLEVQALGIPAWSCGYNILAEDKTSAKCCMSSEGTLQTPFKLRLFGEASFAEWGDFLQSEKTMLVQELGDKALEEHYAYMKTFPDLKPTFDQLDELGLSLPTYQINHLCKFTQGFLLFITYEKVPGSHDIFKRFTKVFDQTYTRFLDLQKAEAQAREARIENALEKVRSRSLAMHKSDELQEVVNTVFERLTDLDMEMDSANIAIFKEGTREYDYWIASPFQKRAASFQIPYIDLSLSRDVIAAKESGTDFSVRSYSFEEKNEWFGYAFEHTDFKFLTEERKAFILQAPAITVGIAFSKHTGVQVNRFSTKPVSAGDAEILKRFSKVFEQAYIRFLDLQKAEAQAREAQIEASLERVRSKTMAMHNSQDVGATVVSMFEELVKLGVDKSIRCGIGILANMTAMEVWTASTNTNGETSLDIGLLDMTIHPLLAGVKAAWENKKSRFVYELAGEDLKNYFKAINAEPDYPVQVDLEKLPDKVIHTDFFFSEGLLFAFSPDHIPEETAGVLKRFAGVFGQTYRRYLDLQKAEAQARESKIEAALERVRSRTLAMQKSDELSETAAEVFRQLISLGIEPNRLYIGIVKEETGDMEMWATDEDGTHVGKKFMFNKNENVSVKKLFDGWKAKEKSVIVDMQGKELEDYFHYLSNVMHIPFKDGLTQKRRVQSVAYFNKGFIGMASPDGQGDETIQLLERFAAVFNLTFTRFNDLKIAEAHAEQAEHDLIAIKEAKQKAEEALTELQSTQKQLIQSEKMASLGELTAGIAHEIQNPLNFVNNFSEVSKEMLDEMREAIEKGDTEEAKEIMNDVIQNLEKINHHGKRADGIVKGMLQHSRSSSGAKEPTDINALADEYLRLAYHGLRAKDKSFNATMKTEYDETIGKVQLISQDIGRVVLNLITNAFYVVNEKSKQNIAGYEPTVSITTSSIQPPLGGRVVQIKVSDNGGGIPQKILDKIFQPFFTTKPTGQGTGLGLSLSYDIVKSHGGELRVETKEGEGSTFTIQIPTN